MPMFSAICGSTRMMMGAALIGWFYGARGDAGSGAASPPTPAAL